MERAWAQAPARVSTESGAPPTLPATLAHRAGRKSRGSCLRRFSLSLSFSLSLFYFGVKVGDGFDQLLILGHPNPLSSARAWVPGCGLEGLGRAREGGGDLDLASSDLIGALVPPLQETYPERTHSLCPEGI